MTLGPKGREQKQPEGKGRGGGGPPRSHGPGFALTYAVKVRGREVAVAVHKPYAHRPHRRRHCHPPLSRRASAGTLPLQRVEFPAGRVLLPPLRARPSAPRVPARSSNWKNGGVSCVGGPFPSAGRGESGRGRRRDLGRRHLPRGLPGALHLEAGRDGNARTVRPLCGKARGRAARGDSGARSPRCAVGTGPVAISCLITPLPYTRLEAQKEPTAGFARLTVPPAPVEAAGETQGVEIDASVSWVLIA